MHASMVHVWEYLTRCGHKFLWLKLTLYLQDIPVRYTERSLKFTARRAVFWSRLMCTDSNGCVQQTVLAVNLLIKRGHA